MALSWRTLHAIPRLISYADADQREANTKPIRGREPEVKPLGRRSQAYYSIKREDNGDICIYSGPLPLLRYRPDDTLLIYDPGYWNKATYNDIILEVTGIRTETKDGKMWARVDGGRYLIRPSPRPKYLGSGMWREPTEPMPENIFKRVEKIVTMGNGRADHGYLTWTYANPPTNTVHHIRRKEMRKVRERYANFVAYATAMDSIRGHTPTQPSDYVELFNVECSKSYDGSVHASWWSNGMPDAIYTDQFRHPQAAELCALMLSEDATDNYKAYLWVRAKDDWGARSGSKNVTERIDRVLTMHHHAEVLKQVEAAKGACTKDRYAWAVPA